jgi:hypothetical protein
MRREVLGNNHPHILTSMSNFASLKKLQRKYDEAESLNVECLKMRREVLGNTHPNTLATMNNLAGL